MPSRLLRVSKLALLAAAAVVGAEAQMGDPLAQAPVVAAATLRPESAGTLGTEVALATGADIAGLDTASLPFVLGTLPGVSVFPSGRAGAPISLLLRGGNPEQTLVMVDGIRFSDPNLGYGAFLGAWRTGPADRIEVAYGPQSALYGADAVGGVVSLQAQKGAGPMSGTIAADAGSFGTVEGSDSVQGVSDGWAYDAALAGGSTGNGQPDNTWQGGNLTLRLDRALTPNLSIGATLRGLRDDYGDPDEVDSPDPFQEDERDLLGTVFADIRASDNFAAHVTVGAVDHELETSASDGVAAERDRRVVASGELTVRLTESNHLVAGIDAEDEGLADTALGVDAPRQRLFAAFAEDEWQPMDGVNFTGSFRRDDDFGEDTANSGRATLSWLGLGKEVKLRASYGTGFAAPSLAELYGRGSLFEGNPDLRPETSAGWDVGFDAYLPQNQTLSVTYFRTDTRDLIAGDDSGASPAFVNLPSTRVEGAEAAVRTMWAGAFHAKLAYTVLKETDLSATALMLLRPDQSVALELWLDSGTGWTFGVDGNYVGKRADIDARSLALVTDPNYTIVRAYFRRRVNARLSISVRVENALQRTYSPLNGYPALGRGFFGGAEWRF
ncbi:MAG: TonB-dependent receptor plug domain-containing protein [Opitutaceae bacterium]